MSGVESCSVDTHELNLEDKGGVGRDDVASTLLTIGVVRRAGKLGLLSNLELHDAFIPAANNLLNTDLELERLTTVSAAVELAAVRERAGVVDIHLVACPGGVRACPCHLNTNDFLVTKIFFKVIQETVSP